MRWRYAAFHLMEKPTEGICSESWSRIKGIDMLEHRSLDVGSIGPSASA
jgi:hypothetical protein